MIAIASIIGIHDVMSVSVPLRRVDRYAIRVRRGPRPRSFLLFRR